MAMVTNARTINVDPTSELGRALAAADETPVLLDSAGRVYRVTPTELDDHWAGYDPARIKAGLKRYAGLITPTEAERMKELVYRGREEGTRPLDRP